MTALSRKYHGSASSKVVLASIIVFKAEDVASSPVERVQPSSSSEHPI
jgi:hypothetical protein